ncbi:UNVERIFIED_CONTAM: hypothetical protein ITI05_24985, partial [Salmonella enterica subsp. enterica serovar Weltevreden]
PTFYVTQQIARSYRLLYDYKNALDWYDKLYEFKTDNTPENLREHAQLLKNAEQYDKAVQVYREYVTRSGGNEMLAEYFASTCVWAK